MKKDQTLANNPTMDDDYLFASSATDCTGLIPSVAHDAYEAENYEEIYHYLPPVAPPLGDTLGKSTDYNMNHLTNGISHPKPNSPLEIGTPSAVSEVGDIGI